MAAYAAAKNGNEVVLFEKNEKLGKKLYITGKGRCNVTNACAPEEFLQNVVRGEKFLISAIRMFPPARLMEFLETEGLPLKAERGNRVFPVSEHASDVTKTLEGACKRVGVKIRLHTEVMGIETVQGTVSGIFTREGKEAFHAVILCTGGVSYPGTGSTGDGYRFAREAGHTVSSLHPSLTGLELKETFPSAQGVTLKNVVLSARRSGKTIFSALGEVLFTHYGISGPLVLTLSADIARLPIGEIALYLDMKPALDEGKLDARLVRDFKERSREEIKNVMRGLLPAGLCKPVLDRAGIPADKRANSVTKGERAALVKQLKEFPLTPISLRGFQEAVVTCGGVSLKEVDPKTMQSKLVKGLYLCGELLDADAYTGGFNLQIAFATGFAAGDSIKCDFAEYYA